MNSLIHACMAVIVVVAVVMAFAARQLRNDTRDVLDQHRVLQFGIKP